MIAFDSKRLILEEKSFVAKKRKRTKNPLKNVQRSIEKELKC